MQPAHFLTPAELLMVEMAQQSGEIPYSRWRKEAAKAAKAAGKAAQGVLL